MASTLDEVESERDLHQRRAAALEAAGGGVAGFMTSELGEDPDKERKPQLLKDVFAQNQEMRESLKDVALRFRSGSARSRCQRPEADAADPAGEAADGPEASDAAGVGPTAEASPSLDQSDVAAEPVGGDDDGGDETATRRRSLRRHDGPRR